MILKELKMLFLSDLRSDKLLKYLTCSVRASVVARGWEGGLEYARLRAGVFFFLPV